jgi:hypothetical protein
MLKEKLEYTISV